MDWDRLQQMGAIVKPIGQPPPLGQSKSQFSATFTQTVRLLAREVEMLDGERVILELELRDRDIRLDGMPRADARPTSPAVAIAFTSKHGPLRYATGEFRDWQDNLRAIALGLEALRAVDRYGVSKRGEQYQGWKALPMSTDPVALIVTRDDAIDVLAHVLDDGSVLGDLPLGDLAAAVKRAQRTAHPDTGGDDLTFRKVMKAKEILGV